MQNFRIYYCWWNVNDFSIGTIAFLCVHAKYAPASETPDHNYFLSGVKKRPAKHSQKGFLSLCLVGLFFSSSVVRCYFLFGWSLLWIVCVFFLLFILCEATMCGARALTTGPLGNNKTHYEIISLWMNIGRSAFLHFVRAHLLQMAFGKCCNRTHTHTNIFDRPSSFTLEIEEEKKPPNSPIKI